MARRNSSISSVQSAGWMSTKRIMQPRSSSAVQGETLASWSSCVTTISSAGARSLPIARLSANVSEVMLGPKTISSGSQPNMAAMAACAAAITSSLRRLVANAPCVLAFEAAKYSPIARITRSGTCVPPGPSKNAAEWPFTFMASAGNCDRTQSMSNVNMSDSWRNAHHAHWTRKYQVENVAMAGLLQRNLVSWK